MTAKKEGVSTTTTKAPKKKVDSTEIESPRPTQESLNNAVQLLLDQMPDYVDQLVTDIATQSFIPKWQLVGGILFEAYNNGYLSAYTLDPSWKDGFKITESECKFCHEKYMPVRIGQLFCCNECGQGRPKIGEEEHLIKEAMKKLQEKKTSSDKKKEGVKGGKSSPILSDLVKSNTKHTSNSKASQASGAGWVEGALE